jgi:hypothetical protein
MKLLKSSWKHQCSADGLFEKGWIVKGAGAGWRRKRKSMNQLVHFHCGLLLCSRRLYRYTTKVEEKEESE